jgi:hypothetical protein
MRMENVAKVGVEPTRVSPLDFESSASAIPPLGQWFFQLKALTASRQVRREFGECECLTTSREPAKQP